MSLPMKLIPRRYQGIISSRIGHAGLTGLCLTWKGLQRSACFQCWYAVENTIIYPCLVNTFETTRLKPSHFFYCLLNLIRAGYMQFSDKAIYANCTLDTQLETFTNLSSRRCEYNCKRGKHGNICRWQCTSYMIKRRIPQIYCQNILTTSNSSRTASLSTSELHGTMSVFSLADHILQMSNSRPWHAMTSSIILVPLKLYSGKISKITHNWTDLKSVVF